MRQAASIPLPFSTRLKIDTRRVHTMAEKTAFMRGFLRGASTVESYAILLRGLYEVYESLETAMEEGGDDAAWRAFRFRTVYRKTAITRDLIYLAGASWATRIPAPVASIRYREHIEKVAAESPELLAAHAYTRYMGDVSGGQILKKIAVNSMALDPLKGGLDFYEFPEIAGIAPFKQEFRQVLDAFVTGDPALEERLIEETVTVQVSSGVFFFRKRVF